MKVQNMIVGIVALGAGAALGYLLKPATEVSPLAPEPGKQSGKAIATVDDAEVKALRQQVKALQARLAIAESQEEELVEQQENRDPARFAEDMKARFEQWKKDNPEEFARMEKRRQEFMQRRAERAKSRIDFLASIDTSRMSAADRETHERLQSLLARREELEGRMQQMMELSDDERGRLFDEMRDTSFEINELNGREREALFKQTAEALGFQGDDVGEISATINEIINATDGGFGGRGPGGPGPGGFGGRGPGGPGGRGRR